MKKLILASVVFLAICQIPSNPVYYVAKPVLPKPEILVKGEEIVQKQLSDIDVSDLVKKEFLETLQCESHFKQFNKDGTVMVSSTGDIGIGQVNKKTWGSTAEKMGLDLDDPEDNAKMAVYILQTAGIKQWVAYTTKVSKGITCK